jgi:hypothetical protein
MPVGAASTKAPPRGCIEKTFEDQEIDPLVSEGKG